MSLEAVGTRVMFDPMGRVEAERITARIADKLDGIADNYEQVMPLIREALTRQAHVALGYASVTAYVSERFSGALSRLSRDIRVPVVQELSAAGMSTRAIAPIVGTTHKTVVKDRQVVPEVPPDADQHVYPQNAPTAVNLSTGEVIDAEAIKDTRPAAVVAPKTVTGLDGKAYTDGRKYARPALTPQPQPAEPATPPRRRPLPDAFFDAVYDLGKKAETVRRLTEDDRFPQNAENVAAKHRNDLLRTRALIDQVLAQLPQEE